MLKMITLKNSGHLVSLEQLCEVRYWYSPSGTTPPPTGIELFYSSGHKTAISGEEAEQVLDALSEAGHDVETLRKRIPKRSS